MHPPQSTRQQLLPPHAEHNPAPVHDLRLDRGRERRDDGQRHQVGEPLRAELAGQERQYVAAVGGDRAGRREALQADEQEDDPQRAEGDRDQHRPARVAPVLLLVAQVDRSVPAAEKEGGDHHARNQPGRPARRVRGAEPRPRGAVTPAACELSSWTRPQTASTPMIRYSPSTIQPWNLMVTLTPITAIAITSRHT